MIVLRSVVWGVVTNLRSQGLMFKRSSIPDRIENVGLSRGEKIAEPGEKPPAAGTTTNSKLKAYMTSSPGL